jgi:hypothetical protein
MTKTGGNMTNNTRGSYTDGDCKINAGDDDHMPQHLRNIEDIKQLTEDIKKSKEIPGGSTPSQYQLPDNATDLQDLIEHRDMNFAMGNIFKACYRSGNCSHSDALRDVNKIIWFSNRELERLKTNIPLR